MRPTGFVGASLARELDKRYTHREQGSLQQVGRMAASYSVSERFRN